MKLHFICVEIKLFLIDSLLGFKNGFYSFTAKDINHKSTKAQRIKNAKHFH
jgi:hypothetical protein